MSESDLSGFGPPVPARETLADFGPPRPAPVPQPATDPADEAAQRVEIAPLSQQEASDTMSQAVQLRIDPRWGTQSPENAKTVQRLSDEVRTREQLERAPKLADFMNRSPANAALVKRDVPVLSMLGESLELGFVDLGIALKANQQAKVGLSPEEEEHLAFTEQVAAAGASGRTNLPRKVGAEVARAAPTVVTFASATGVGAAIGSVGGPLGAALGGLAGAGFAAYTLNFGPLYRRLRGLTKEDGETPVLTEDQAKNWAAAGSTVAAAVQTATGANFLRAVPGVNAALRAAGLDAAERAVQSTLGRAAVQRLAEYSGHVLSGAVAMAGQSAANAATVELAKQQNGADPDWGAVGDAGMDGFVSGLLLFPLPLAHPVLDFVRDVGRIRNARLDAFALNAYTAMAKDVNLRKVDSAQAEAIFTELAGPEAPTVFISPEGLTPEHMNGVAKVAGPEAVADAVATNGDIPVPIGRYLAHLTDQHDGMRENVKLSPDGMNGREADLAGRDPLATALAEREVAKTMPPGPERRAAIDAAHEKVRDAAMAKWAGTPEEWNGALKPEVLDATAGALGVKAPEPAKPPSESGLRSIAARKVETMRLGDLAPGRRRLAAENLARKAAEAGAQVAAAGAEGTPTTPGRALNKLQDIAELERAREANLAMARAEEVAQKGAETDRKFLLRYTQDTGREDLGKAGGTHLEQVDRLLSGFELGQGASRTEVARRQATMQWIAEEQAANRDPVIPDSVMAKLDRFVHWKELTPPELRDLRAAVESVVQQAKLKNTLLEKQARVDRARALDQLTTALRDNTKEVPFRPRGTVVERLGKVLESLNGLTYGLRAVERIVNTLDGGDINGPWHRYVWDPINDGTNRWHDLARKTSDVLTKMLNDLPAEDARRWRETRFTAAGQQWDLTAAIAVALNSGNDSNARKMLEGWQHESVAARGLQTWDATTPEQFLKQLTRKDWEFVTSVWDGLETMWPESAALEKRLTGVEPPKVKARPFTRTLEDGSKVDLKGGYYPVIYDPDFSRQGAAGEEVTSVKLFDQNYHRAATPQGRLQARIEGFARPVLLTLDNLPNRISEAAKDVAMREALISVHSALTDDSLRAALHTSELGRAGEKALIGWLRDTANDLVVPDNGSGPWFTIQNKTRSGYTASLFAYNLAQTWQNLTGVIPATKAVGGKWMGKALARYARERTSLTDWAMTQSAELRNEDKGGQVLAEAIREAAKGKGLTTGMMRFGVNMFRATDLAVKFPTWIADYMRSTALVEDGGRGLTHEEAVKQADATVRLNTMATNTKDLPALLRNRVGRWMLPLYSYSMHRLNMFGDALSSSARLAREHKFGTGAALLGGVWGTLAAEAVLSEIVKGNGPQDENNDGEVTAADWAIWTAKVSATAPLTWLPFIGNAIRTAATGRDPLTTPEVAVFASAGRTARDAYTVAAAKLAGEELDDQAVHRLAMRLVETGGYALGAATAGRGGLPVSQIRATAGYLLDENSPKETPLQVGLGVAFGKKRPGKLISLTE